MGKVNSSPTTTCQEQPNMESKDLWNIHFFNEFLPSFSFIIRRSKGDFLLTLRYSASSVFLHWLFSRPRISSWGKEIAPGCFH